MQDLQAKVAKFRINSQEVMQLIHINVDVLAPSDIMLNFAKILFQPVLWRMSPSKNGDI